MLYYLTHPITVISLGYFSYILFRYFKNRESRRLKPGKSELEPWQDNVSVLDDSEAFGYRVFTTKFDKTIPASVLVRAPEDRRLVDKLDRAIDKYQSVSDDIKINLENLFQEEGNQQVVSFLIDNSGSMHGQNSLVATSVVVMLSRILEDLGVAVEILGFTTVEWRGGKSRELWIESGKPADPGRLNDLLHIVFKDADTPVKQACLSLATMLARDGRYGRHLKENIDGEALIWAYSRLMTRAEPRKLLVVVSDGAPVDDATLSANSDTFLERHLRHVTRDIERRGHVDLYAIGVSYEVPRYYSNSLALLEVEDIERDVAPKLVHIFDALERNQRAVR